MVKKFKASEDPLVYPSEFKSGMEEELEHTDITGGDKEKTKAIVLAHLAEDPKYYSKLKVAMKATEEKPVEIKQIPEKSPIDYKASLLDLLKKNKKIEKPEGPPELVSRQHKPHLTRPGVPVGKKAEEEKGILDTIKSTLNDLTESPKVKSYEKPIPLTKSVIRTQSQKAEEEKEYRPWNMPKFDDYLKPRPKKKDQTTLQPIIKAKSEEYKKELDAPAPKAMPETDVIGKPFSGEPTIGKVKPLSTHRDLLKAAEEIMKAEEKWSIDQAKKVAVPTRESKPRKQPGALTSQKLPQAGFKKQEHTSFNPYSKTKQSDPSVVKVQSKPKPARAPVITHSKPGKTETGKTPLQRAVQSHLTRKNLDIAKHPVLSKPMVETKMKTRDVPILESTTPEVKKKPKFGEFAKPKSTIGQYITKTSKKGKKTMVKKKASINYLQAAEEIMEAEEAKKKSIQTSPSYQPAPKVESGGRIKPLELEKRVSSPAAWSEKMSKKPAKSSPIQHPSVDIGKKTGFEAPKVPGQLKAEEDNDTMNELYSFMTWLIDRAQGPVKQNYAQLKAQYDVETYAKKAEEEVGKVGRPSQKKQDAPYQREQTELQNLKKDLSNVMPYSGEEEMKKQSTSDNLSESEKPARFTAKPEEDKK